MYNGYRGTNTMKEENGKELTRQLSLSYYMLYVASGEKHYLELARLKAIEYREFEQRNKKEHNNVLTFKLKVA